MDCKGKYQLYLSNQKRHQQHISVCFLIGNIWIGRAHHVVSCWLKSKYDPGSPPLLFLNSPFKNIFSLEMLVLTFLKKESKWASATNLILISSRFWLFYMSLHHRWLRSVFSVRVAPFRKRVPIIWFCHQSDCRNINWNTAPGFNIKRMLHLKDKAAFILI